MGWDDKGWPGGQGRPPGGGDVCAWTSGGKTQKRSAAGGGKGRGRDPGAGVPRRVCGVRRRAQPGPAGWAEESKFLLSILGNHCRSWPTVDARSNPRRVGDGGLRLTRCRVRRACTVWSPSSLTCPVPAAAHPCLSLTVAWGQAGFYASAAPLPRAPLAQELGDPVGLRLLWTVLCVNWANSTSQGFQGAVLAPRGGSPMLALRC